MQQPKLRTIHVYYEEEGAEPIIEAEDERAPEPETKHRTIGFVCATSLVLLCVGMILLPLWLPQLYPDTYDTTIARSIALTLSQHPAPSEVTVYALMPIKKVEQTTVEATGSLHQEATRAIGLITFYNGLFTAQRVPAGTELRGKDGIVVVTDAAATIPPATTTTPPTSGTVSVTAYSEEAGEAGNITAQDINQVCCGGAILAQNLYAFSGGHEARDISVLTQADLDRGQQHLADLAKTEVNNQASGEEKPGDILLPLSCKSTFTASHQAGDQAASAVLTLVAVCHPLAYFAPDIIRVAQQDIALPRGYRLISFSAFVYASHLTSQGGTLTVQAIAYLKQNTPVVHYRFAGK